VRFNLIAKFMIPTVAVVLLTMALFGWIIARMLEGEVRNRANEEAKGQAESVLANLQSVDQLSSASVRSAMKVLLREAQQIGAPEIKGTINFGGEAIPELRLGSSSQAGNFSLVDRIKNLTGSTATLFVKRGDSFLRISTNVLKPDGSRAIGTVLDPKGRAFAAVQKGQSFYGVVNILGVPYMTGYEPMNDDSGQIIGVWYVGFPLTTIGDLGKRISAARILDSGFVALLQPDGKIVAKSENVNEDEVHSRLQHIDKADWVVLSEPFEKWGYTLVAAYPQADVKGNIRLWMFLLALFLSLLVVLTQYVLMSRVVLSPVRRLVARMAVDTSQAHHEDDEIGVLTRAFDHFVNNMRATLAQVMHVSEQVASGSKEISSAATRQARGAETQRDQTTEVATAMQEMATTVQQIADNCNQAAKASRNAAETAERGGAVVSGTLAKMRAIAGSVSATADKLKELDSASEQIGRIIGVIDDIADQTNLLALNAAIEAARAGEQGRGFAVVADEVRKLAGRTTAATKEIAQTIGSMQEETRNAVAAMRRGTQQVEDGVQTTAKAGDSLKEIIQMSEQVGGMITQIATATTGQLASTDEINNHLEGISRLVSDSAQSSQLSATSCQNLSSLALDLQQMVANFEIGDHEDTGESSSPVQAAEVGERAQTFAAGAH